MAARPKLLGTLKHREYYLNPEGKILYRIPDLREAVRARAGYKILCTDFSQIEVRIMANMSGDPWLIEALNSGKDIHCYMAADVYKIPYDEFYKEYKAEKDRDELGPFSIRRSNIKTTTFGVPYGAGPNKVALMTGLTVEEAEVLMADYFSKAVKLKEWIEARGMQALTGGYSRSYRGRMRFYTLPKSNDKHAKEINSQIRRWAGNHPVQASCVDMLKPAMYRMYLGFRGGVIANPRIYDAKILFCVHDEIVVEAKQEQVGPVKEIMIKAINDIYNECIDNITHSADIKVSDFWSK